MNSSTSNNVVCKLGAGVDNVKNDYFFLPCSAPRQELTMKGNCRENGMGFRRDIRRWNHGTENTAF